MNVKKIFTLLMVLYPLLFLYSVGYSSIKIPDVLLVILTFFLLSDTLYKKNYFLISIELIPYFCCILFHLIYSFFLDENNKVVGTTFRYFFYLGTLFFWSRKYFLIDYGIEVFKHIGIVATSFIILQTILYNFFHLFLPGYIQNSFFPVLANQIAVLESNLNQNWFSYLRPSSFFTEPAQYAEYMLGIQTIMLFCKNNTKIASFFSLGILLSMSSTGIITLSFIWGLYAYKKIKQRMSIILLSILIVLIPTCFFIILNSFFWRNFENRMIDGSSTAGRFDGYLSVFSYVHDEMSSFIFGIGMNTEFFSNYLAGYARLILFFGFCGFLCFLFFIVYILAFKQCQKWQIVLLLVFIALNIGTELLFQPVILTFLPFILCYENHEKNSLHYSKLQ